MQISATIATPGKLDQEWQDTCLNVSNTICYWNASLAPQIEQTASQEEKIMTMKATQTMKTSQFALTNISASSTCKSKFSLWIGVTPETGSLVEMSISK